MIHYWGNIVEGVFWIGIAGVVYLRMGKETDGQMREIATRAAVAFFWFGISDFIEVRTGAWYSPAWLLLMKVACVTILVHCLAQYARRNRQRKCTESKPDVIE